jgi:hypothetical protein
MRNIAKYESTTLLLLAATWARGQFPIFVSPQVTGTPAFGVGINGALAAQRAAVLSNPYLSRRFRPTPMPTPMGT